MSSSKEAAILLVIPFLLVILIYSSFSRSDMVFAKQKVTSSPVTCSPWGRYATGYWVECCQTQTDASGLEITYCTICSNTQPPSDCGPRYIKAEKSCNPPNPLPPKNLPPPPSSSLPSPPLPPTNALPPSISQQTTCTNGLAPDANGNCPISTTTPNQTNFSAIRAAASS
jgi:hypothetical protein